MTGPMDEPPADEGTVLVINERLRVYPDEIEERFVLASGPGGQNVNKVATAVQFTFHAARARGLTPAVKDRLFAVAGHLVGPGGTIRIEAKRFRSQERNRKDARARLAALIESAAAPPPPPRKATKPTKGSVKRRLAHKARRADIKSARGRVVHESDD